MSEIKTKDFSLLAFNDKRITGPLNKRTGFSNNPQNATTSYGIINTNSISANTGSIGVSGNRQRRKTIAVVSNPKNTKTIGQKRISCNNFKQLKAQNPII